MSINTNNWQHYLTRPFSLFGCSLWYTWYADYAQKFAKHDISDMLSVEESINVVRNYRRKKNLEHFTTVIGELARDNTDNCLSLLRKGFELNKQAEEYLTQSDLHMSLKEAGELFFENALYATILPHFVILGMEQLHVKNDELFTTSTQLRAVSMYPKIMTNIVIPTAIVALQDKEIPNPEYNVEILQLSEILDGDFSQLEHRQKMRESNQLYVYEAVNRNISITWHHSTKEIIQVIEQHDLDVAELKGQIAYKGKVKGIARIITSIDGKGAVFNDGDILVSINSNPNLMPLIQKSAAIVTDEGGITCHAAIVSREMRIPCVIGTKIATQILKDGDLIEVDAINGIVKLINK